MSIEDGEFLRVLELNSKFVKENTRDQKAGDSKTYKNNEEKLEKKDKFKNNERSRKRTRKRKETTNLKTPKKH
jgi:hypothetical protein